MTASTSRHTVWLVGIGIGALALFGLCALCGLVAFAIGYFNFSGAARAPAGTPSGAFPGEMVIPDEGREHAPQGAPIAYQHYPPSSGTHYPVPAQWGVYSEPIPEGTFVHNLEHAGIVVLYNCPDACDELQQQLQDFYDRAPTEAKFGEVKILITPYERELPTQLVALAWGHQLNLEEFDEDLLLRWYRRFVDKCCEDVP